MNKKKKIRSKLRTRKHMSQGNINININITNSKKSDNSIHKVSNLVINRTPKFKSLKEGLTNPNSKIEKSSFQVNFRKNTDHLIYSKYSEQLGNFSDNKKKDRKKDHKVYTRPKNFSDLNTGKHSK
jgi:hypothetical protein